MDLEMNLHTIILNNINKICLECSEIPLEKSIRNEFKAVVWGIIEFKNQKRTLVTC